MKPRLFIGCSTEALPIGYAVQEALECDAHVTVFTQDVFKPSVPAIEAILDAVSHSDFGLFILAPDDLTLTRGVSVQVPRDNVLFELGVFSGRLGRKAFFMMPSDIPDFHLPSDLLGITSLMYESGRENIQASVGPACNKIRKALQAYGHKLRPVGRFAEATVVISPNDGSVYAASRMKSANRVRIVGTARQDVLIEEVHAAAYLQATEERVASSSPFSYLRITSKCLSTPFRQHLFRLLQGPKVNAGVRVEIAVEERMDASISYMIFDSDDLLLIVDNPVFGGVRDNRLMVWCGEVDVVRAFADHFDNAWNRLPNRCTTKAQLERETFIRK